MQTHQLIPHPAHPPRRAAAITATLAWKPFWLTLRFRVEQAGELVVPPPAGRRRADELWRTTCFELFVRDGGGGAYCEFNLSPSEQWAAYDFSARREGMRDRPVLHDPVCTWRGGSGFALFDAAIPLSAFPALPAAIGLTCVLEESGGAKSYWALSHHGDAPDFHDPACFTATLAPPEAS